MRQRAVPDIRHAMSKPPALPVLAELLSGAVAPVICIGVTEDRRILLDGPLENCGLLDGPGAISEATVPAEAIVLAPLISERYDIHELGEALVEAGFRGRLIALAAPLPRPKLVLSEMRASFPGFRFDLAADPATPTAGSQS